jgi:hypothetical protein
VERNALMPIDLRADGEAMWFLQHSSRISPDPGGYKQQAATGNQQQRYRTGTPNLASTFSCPDINALILSNNAVVD